MFPIAFMPAVVRDVLVWLSFPYELSFPVVVFMQRVHGAEVWSGVAIQAFWVVTTGLMAKTMWKIGLNSHETAGGTRKWGLQKQFWVWHSAFTKPHSPNLFFGALFGPGL